MDEDFVSSLGTPMLAHRLRRASERLVEGTSGFLRAQGFAAPARAGSMLILLETEGLLGITELAHRLRLSHPMIIKLTDALHAAGLAEARGDAGDQRRRLIALTGAGLEQAALIRRMLE